jgi:hypothetical protein
MRVVAIIAIASVLALTSIAGAQQNRPAPKRPEVGGVSSPADAMIFYVARGPAGACGTGCSEWIAAEGEVQWDTHKRMFAILDRFNDRKRPVMIDTWGGASLNVALSLGRILRERGLDASVAVTRPEGCRGVSESACFNVKRSGTPVDARLDDSNSHCDITCILMLAGGVQRKMNADTRVMLSGMTVSNRLGLNVSRERREGLTEKFTNDFRRYFTEMGVDPELIDMMNRAGGRDIALPDTEWLPLRLVTRAPY